MLISNTIEVYSYYYYVGIITQREKVVLRFKKKEVAYWRYVSGWQKSQNCEVVCLLACFFSKFHVVATIGHTQFNELGESVNPPLSAVTAGRKERSEINSKWFEFNIISFISKGNKAGF